MLRWLACGFWVVCLTACSGSTASSPETDGASGSGVKCEVRCTGNTSGTGGNDDTGVGGAAGGTGGGSSGSCGAPSGGSGGTSLHDCTNDLSALDRSCEVDDDCVIVARRVDCCGRLELLGIPRDNQARYQALEQRCTADIGWCDCLPQPTKLEDGTELLPDAPDPIAACVEGQCRSRAGSRTRGPSCGDQACGAAEYCEQFSGGVPESGTSYTCKSLGQCTDCACLGSSPACTCGEADDGIHVSCAAP